MSGRTRLVVLFAGLLALLFVTLASWLPARVDQQSRSLVETRALELARLTAAAAEAAVDFDDPVSAARVLGDLRGARGASYAVLVRGADEELAAWGRPASGLPLVPDGSEQVVEGGGLLHLRVPFATRLGRRGVLLVGFELDDLEERRRETRAFVAAACAVVFLAGLLATFVLGSLLARPLGLIASIARRIAAGEVTASAELAQVPGVEAGAVARAMGLMLDQLYQQRSTIETLAAGLEERIAGRTAELETANHALADRLVELRRTQEQLIVADRRVSIGRLAAGVAHEINNPLAFIKANLSFAGDAVTRLADPAQAREDTPLAQRRYKGLVDALAESSEGVERVHKIVRGLKTFARTDEDSRAPMSVADALAVAIDMSAHELRHRATLVRELLPAPLVDGNNVRLSQVFLNLLLNAVQAIPEGQPGGLIGVSLRTDAEGWAVVEVRDNGAGIPRDHLPHIFDPFFTTKPVGSGTGLGLSISQGIVLALGGDISVESQLGNGTAFRVRLPPSAGGQPGKAVPPAAEPAPLPRGRLLVVDDEQLVGAAVRRMLEGRHEVTVATSGRQALELIRDGARFDHILCDVMMPEMDGMGFHEELTRLSPQQAQLVTFMTGGAFTERASNFVERYRGAWVEKPIDLAELRRIFEARA